jgi:hypothetical protein
MPSSNSEKKNVTFLPTIKLILIPSRGEFKAAGLNNLLWWTGNDFFGFQQSAHSEIRLLSSYENIGMKEARKKLYQPDHNDTHSAILERSGSGSSSSVNGNNDAGDFDDFFVVGDDDEKEETVVTMASTPPRNEGQWEGSDDGEETTGSSFHKVSSLALIPDSLRHQEVTPPREEAAARPVPLFPKVSSLDGLAAAFRDEGDETSSSSSSRSPSGRGQALPTPSSWNDENVLLLCVPVDQPAPLSCGPSYSWRSAMRRKPSKSSFSSTTLAFCSTIILVAFVLADRYCLLNATM